MRPVAVAVIRPAVAELNRVLEEQNAGIRIAMKLDMVSSRIAFHIENGMCSELSIEDDGVRPVVFPEVGR